MLPVRACGLHGPGVPDEGEGRQWVGVSATMVLESARPSGGLQQGKAEAGLAAERAEWRIVVLSLK